MARTMLRIPKSMREDIAAFALRNRRSVNSEIVYRLEQTLQVEGATPGDTAPLPALRGPRTALGS